MTAPESAGEHSPSLALRVARARHAATFQAMGWMPWDDAPKPYRSDALRQAQEHLDAMEAAGLAVVELPEPIEVLQPGQAGRNGERYTWHRAEFPGGVAGLWDEKINSVLLSPALIGASHHEDAVQAAGSILAAAAWAKRQGGDSR